MYKPEIYEPIKPTTLFVINDQPTHKLTKKYLKSQNCVKCGAKIPEEKIQRDYDRFMNSSNNIFNYGSRYYHCEKCEISKNFIC